MNGSEFLGSGESVHEFTAPAKTLNQILISAQAPRVIDLLSLDVEGNELSVLNGLDFEHFQFEYLCIETRSINNISHFLLERGYTLVETLSGHDYLFKKVKSYHL
jgi:hypothetical protein